METHVNALLFDANHSYFPLCLPTFLLVCLLLITQMGATLSAEEDNFWDTAKDLAGGREVRGAAELHSAEEETATTKEEEEEEEEEESVRREYVNKNGEEDSKEGFASDEIISRNPLQEAQSALQLVQIHPSAISAHSTQSSNPINLRTVYSAPYRDKVFFALFILHLLGVAVAIVYMVLRLLLHDKSPTKLHNMREWCPKLGLALIVGNILACTLPMCMKKNAKVMVKVVLWASCLLTLAAALMLISTGLLVNVGLGIFFFLSAMGQSLYSCWVSNRLSYAGDVFSVALTPANQGLFSTFLVPCLVLFVASLWIIIWTLGLVGALNLRYSALIIVALFLSLAWTMEILRNIVHSTIAGVLYKTYMPTNENTKSLLRRACTTSFGSICLGSVMVPILHVLQVMARATSKLDERNKLCFSCADCFVTVMKAFNRFAHNWGYVQVLVDGKPFVRASQETWNLFERSKMSDVIDADITSSICMLSGICGGMGCVIVCGGWAFATHKATTASISIVAFLIGYFLVRVGMAHPQGSVAAHYICYAQDPTSQLFLNTPLSQRLKELAGEQV